MWIPTAERLTMPTPDSWPALLLGWPSALGGGLLLVAGLVQRKPWLAALGALASAGFCFYLSLNPIPLRLLGPAALACNFASAVALRRPSRWLAVALVLPHFMALAQLAIAIRAT